MPKCLFFSFSQEKNQKKIVVALLFLKKRHENYVDHSFLFKLTARASENRDS